MGRFASRRIVVTIAVACLLSLGGAAAYALEPSEPISACVGPNGVLKVATSSSECKSNETAISLASSEDVATLQSTLNDLSDDVASLESEDTALSNRIAALEAQLSSRTITSENGQFSIAVTNGGITLSGSGSTVEVSFAGVSVYGAGTVSVNGSMVTLNCGAGSGRPVARIGDPIVGTGNGGSDLGPVNINGFISGGSGGVLSC